MALESTNAIGYAHSRFSTDIQVKADVLKHALFINQWEVTKHHAGAQCDVVTPLGKSKPAVNLATHEHAVVLPVYTEDFSLGVVVMDHSAFAHQPGMRKSRQQFHNRWRDSRGLQCITILVAEEVFRTLLNLPQLENLECQIDFFM